MVRFRYKLVLFFSLIVVLAGIYGVNFWRASEEIPNYRTEKIVKGNITKSISANGTLNVCVQPSHLA
jgi:hypothetical protein